MELKNIIKEVKEWHREQEEMLALMIENAYKAGQLAELKGQLAKTENEKKNNS